MSRKFIDDSVNIFKGDGDSVLNVDIVSEKFTFKNIFRMYTYITESIPWISFDKKYNPVLILSLVRNPID